MKVINTEKLRAYIVECLRVFIILFVIYVLNNFTSSLPFVSGINIFNDNIFLSEVISFIMMVLSCFIIYEFAKRSEACVNDMIIFIPQSGIIHSYAVYLAVIITAYFSGYNIFLKIAGNDWLWSYSIIFAGFSLFYIAKIIIIFYKNSHSVSSNIVNIFSLNDFKK